MSKNEFICDCNIIHEDIVKDTLGKMPEDDIFNKLAEFFKILRRYNKSKNFICIRPKWNVCMWYSKCTRNE